MILPRVNGIKDQPHIVIVEDNEDLALLLILSLQRFDIQTVWLENGRLFLHHMEQASQYCQLVFMDCEMPVLNGYKATQQWRQHEQQNQLKHTPIIALSAHDSQEHRRQIQSAGMNEVLIKPCSPKQLQHTLDKWMLTVIKPDKRPHIHIKKRTQNTLLDTDRLAQMELEDLDILIHLFASVCPKRQKSLTQAWSSKNSEDIRMAAHSFKSSAISIGAKALGEACFIIEDSNRHQLDLTQDNLNHLLDLIQPSIAAMKHYLAQLQQ